jgi:Protein of unknown function (DUF3148)
MAEKFTIGSTVKIIILPPYIKTADPMPMLRPAQLVGLGAVGTVIDRLPGDHWVVKFERGTFLLDSQYLAADTPV